MVPLMVPTTAMEALDHWRLFGQLGLLWQLPSHFVSHPPVNHLQTFACDPSRMADINQGMVQFPITSYPWSSRGRSIGVTSHQGHSSSNHFGRQTGGWRDWSSICVLKVDNIKAKYQCVIGDKQQRMSGPQ